MDQVLGATERLWFRGDLLGRRLGVLLGPEDVKVLA